MRRGHAGIGGWRNENPRNFRPRGGGPPQFRPGRNYPAQETPRFPQPGSRPPRGTFNSRSGLMNTLPADHHDRNIYRHDSRPGSQYRQPDRSHHQGTRSLYPIFDRMREAKDQSKYKERPFYDNTTSDSWRLNSMGDIDERQTNHSMNHELYGVHVASPWTGPDKRPYYDERNTQIYIGESSKIPVVEYSGHRPPSSDHYGGNPSSTLDNSNSFSRSVDDTVDIIRKRLQNRGEHQESSECSNSHKDIDDRIPNSMSNQSTQQTQPAKKRVQRQRQNLDVNCDKMKSKIVHELFKMDKDKIHKLMDNPSSSSKFEYALNSFITESQNSLNRHLRSVAEKSLCTSEEFVHNDNNTIYEDTFLKQMQGVLDPQDTILLEDIKPLVLAELSKVLQLNEYDQPFQMADQGNYEVTNENQNYNLSNTSHYEGYSENQYYEQIQSPHNIMYDTHGPNNDTDNIDFTNFEFEPKPATPKPLFERRTARKSMDNSDSNPRADFQKQPRTSVDANTFMKDSFSIERRYSRRSFDNKPSQEIERQIPLFDTNADQLSDEEDPFAEFDKQYHVAVDHNFIEADISSPLQSTTCVLNQENNNKSPYHQDINFEIKSTTLDENYIKQEIDSQLHNIAKSSLKLSIASKTQDKIMSVTSGHTTVQVKQEVLSSPTKNCNNNKDQESVNPVSVNIIQEHISHVDSNEVTAVENTENINSPVKVLPSNSRKRSIDQKPSHRKEKRKKSDSTPSDSGKQILNKNIIINVNDCSSNETEKCKEAPKSIFNLYFSKEQSAKEVPKETKKIESTDKAYSEKYVKRKETQKKGETDTAKKRQRSVSSSHSIVSPKENLNNYSQGNKPESKTKLQSIDMFSEQPKKITHLNQACKEIEIVSKPKPPVITFNKKVTKRHISTQVSRKSQSRETQTFESKRVTTRFSQTERKKTFNKIVQTDPVKIEKQGPKATDTLERMKEIDLEIQVLLQEKFKLYNSIESGDPCPSTIQSLGVTVVNVTPDEGIKENEESEVETLSGDIIVEDFTSIPVEELEQLAFETIEAQNETKKKSRRQKIVNESRANSSSPTSRRNAKKGHTPNISLLEQIITDDRPLEDIISLDDLETTPVKSKKQKRPLEILLDDFETTPVNSKNKKLKKVSTKPKKKAIKKSKTVKPTIGKIDNKLIECFVLLTREDFSEYLKPKIKNVEVQNGNIQKIENVEVRNENVEAKNESIEIVEQEILIDDTNNIDVVEETVANDLQFDMLDVSEDIVIGDNCEVKSNEDKDVERVEVVPSEEIILDNSQSSESVQVDFNQCDNICKMYDYSTDEILRHDSVVVTGHADAVLAIECIENNFIAACLDGNVYHFGADGQLITTLRGSNLAVTCLTIVKEKYGTTVYTGSLDSRIRYYDLDTGLEKGPECNVLSPIQTMDRAWDTIFVGTRTGFVLQFECKNNMLIPVSTVKFSDQSILALRAMKEGPRKVLLVAARSEDVTIKDAQTGLLLRSLQGPKMTVYTLLYEDGKIYCGTSSHQIHVFDYASGSHLGAHEGGKGAVCLRAAGGLVFAGCYDGCVYIYREGEPKPLAQLRGPGLMLLSLAVVDTRIIAGYKDRSLYIWKIPQSVQQEMIL